MASILLSSAYTSLASIIFASLTIPATRRLLVDASRWRIGYIFVHLLRRKIDEKVLRSGENASPAPPRANTWEKREETKLGVQSRRRKSPSLRCELPSSPFALIATSPPPCTFRPRGWLSVSPTESVVSLFFYLFIFSLSMSSIPFDYSLISMLDRNFNARISEIDCTTNNKIFEMVSIIFFVFAVSFLTKEKLLTMRLYLI